MAISPHRAYRPSEIVRECHLPRDVVYDALHDGTLPAVRRPRGYLIGGAALIRWLEDFGSNGEEVSD